MELIDSIPVFGSFMTSVIAFIVVLSVIVFIHEFGHYIVGRWCGIHAEVFSLGFGPALIARTDQRGTKWQIATIPFGGYVKFLGDANAASRTDVGALALMDRETRSRSFPGAKLYRKALTIAAGPMANFILSTVIFAVVILISGKATEAPEVGALKPLPVVYQDIQPDDRILAINGVKTPDYTALYEYARSEGARLPDQEYLLLRNGREHRVAGPVPLLALVESVQPQSPAMAAGMKKGDLIQSVDGQEIFALFEMQEIVSNSADRELTLGVWRDGEIIKMQLTAERVDFPDGQGGFEKRVLIGITGGLFFEPKTITPGIVETITFGVGQVWHILTNSLNGLWHIISGSISSCNLQGPVGIAKTSGDAATQGWMNYVWFIGVLSTAIGMLNLFPVPVLDGGHLVFFAYEAVVGRAPPQRIVQALMFGGMVVVLMLMSLGLTNDFLC